MGYLHIVREIVLFGGVEVKAVRDLVKVLAANAADEAFCLKEVNAKRALKCEFCEQTDCQFLALQCHAFIV